MKYTKSLKNEVKAVGLDCLADTAFEKSQNGLYPACRLPNGRYDQDNGTVFVVHEEVCRTAYKLMNEGAEVKIPSAWMFNGAFSPVRFVGRTFDLPNASDVRATARILKDEINRVCDDFCERTSLNDLASSGRGDDMWYVANYILRNATMVQDEARSRSSEGFPLSGLAQTICERLQNF